jgi:hypothetical protein
VRLALTRPQWTVERYALRHRLGVLLGGREGGALVDEADEFLRAGGVVDVARYLDGVMPGLASPVRSA